MLYQVFKVVQQQGAMALESHFENAAQSPILSKYPKFLGNHHALDFLSDSAKVIIVGGIASHDLEALMDEDLKVAPRRGTQAGGARSPRSATRSPASASSPPCSASSSRWATSMVRRRKSATTSAPRWSARSLGILMSYGFVSPLAARLESTVTDDGYYCLCIKAGLLATYKGNAPAIAIEFARRVLPSDVRPTFNETEQFCRAAAAPNAAAA